MLVQRSLDLYMILTPEGPQFVDTLGLSSALIASYLSLKKALRALITAWWVKKKIGLKLRSTVECFQWVATWCKLETAPTINLTNHSQCYERFDSKMPYHNSQIMTPTDQLSRKKFSQLNFYSNIWWSLKSSKSSRLTSICHVWGFILKDSSS